ncbi:MAG: hypothetical protein OXH73_19325 [Caldilineaceae bacterium]|nr:hypothetical protein [Caldilineaceae bacterium]
MAQTLPELRQHLANGQVIPAHPLALTADLKLDERRQRALTRYYCAAGAGGLAVGVHTTQFELHQPAYGLLEPVLELASETVDEHMRQNPRPFVKVAGILGDTRQAVREAETALDHGYDAGLLSLRALAEASPAELIEHCRRVAEVIPVFGFYLQTAVGGQALPYRFWREFVEIENVVAIKVAPFDRYKTLDVVRAVAESCRSGEIALYTGNDDNIVADLLTEFSFGGQETDAPPLRIVGGLLGQWAVWTREAVAMLRAIHDQGAAGRLDYGHWLTYNAQMTDANAAVFDSAHDFHGCISGVHEVLRRQGLMQGIWCFNPQESLSPGQCEELDRVCRAYPHLTDDEFVAEHLDEWLR